MNKYIVLYLSDAALSGMSTAEAFANTPPEQLEAGMAAWGTWAQNCGTALIDMGAPLDGSTLISAEGISKFPSAISGFGILEAESLEAATKLMEGHPHFFMPGASVQVLEFVKIPGM